MKIRHGFVSNSSSTAFIITNSTNKDLDLIDFVNENPQLIEQYVKKYCYDDYNYKDEYTQENLVISAARENETLNPGDNHVVFGDEDCTLIGRVFDYILRDGGSSERFSWKFKEYYR